MAVVVETCGETEVPELPGVHDAFFHNEDVLRLCVGMLVEEERAVFSGVGKCEGGICRQERRIELRC